MGILVCFPAPLFTRNPLKARDKSGVPYAFATRQSEQKKETSLRVPNEVLGNHEKTQREVKRLRVSSAECRSR